MANNNTTIIFAAPAALDTATVGTERDTNITDFNLTSRPRIMDATHEVDPAVGLSYDFGIRRGSVISIISKTPNMLRASRPAAGLSVGFPSAPINQGQFQFVIIQRVGALTATNVNIQTDLAVW